MQSPKKVGLRFGFLLTEVTHAYALFNLHCTGHWIIIEHIIFTLTEIKKYLQNFNSNKPSMDYFEQLAEYKKYFKLTDPFKILSNK